MRRTAGASFAALALAAALLAGAAGAGAQSAPAAPKSSFLAATPYMGWDTYFALPGGFPETKILQEADALKTTGLEADGYRLIWLDAGWWQGQRDTAGNMVVSPTQWPHGIAWWICPYWTEGLRPCTAPPHQSTLTASTPHEASVLMSC